ncbi:hypothetical protein MTP99_008366 [Tenebrio molitor]|nr:hypothetical protein MTP99_008366 [Tenebrio molitor]
MFCKQRRSPKTLVSTSKLIKSVLETCEVSLRFGHPERPNPSPPGGVGARVTSSTTELVQVHWSYLAGSQLVPCCVVITTLSSIYNPRNEVLHLCGGNL